jgi:hypothetical protein
LWHSVHPEGAPYEEGAQERFQAVAGAVGSAPKEGAEVPFRAVARAAPPQCAMWHASAVEAPEGHAALHCGQSPLATSTTAAISASSTRSSE